MVDIVLKRGDDGGGGEEGRAGGGGGRNEWTGRAGWGRNWEVGVMGR